MTRTGTVLMAVVMGMGLVAPAGTRAAAPRAMAKADHAMACSVVVDYSLNNVVRLSYVKDFEVDPETPFSDDFSTATRFKFFDACHTFFAGGAALGTHNTSDSLTCARAEN